MIADTLRQSLIDLGDTPASVQMETIDLRGSHKAITAAVEELDRKYGPISHLYAISGISNHLDDKKPWGMVRLILESVTAGTEVELRK